MSLARTAWEQEEGRTAAKARGLSREEAAAALAPALPAANPDDAELQDARWFHRDWLRAVVAGVHPPPSPLSPHLLPPQHAHTHTTHNGHGHTPIFRVHVSPSATFPSTENDSPVSAKLVLPKIVYLQLCQIKCSGHKVGSTFEILGILPSLFLMVRQCCMRLAV